MLPLRIIFIQRIDDGIQMLFIAQKICIGSIHKNCFDIVLPNILCVSFLQAEKIIIRYPQLVRTISFLNIFLQFVHRCVQVNNNIWLNDLWIDNIKLFLIESEFFIRQIHFCKQQTFGKKVI